MTVAEIRILVAHDQRNVRGNLKMTLQGAGYRVDTTDDSEEVVARCHRREYNIVFLNINMPKIDSLDVIRCIRASSKKTTVVIVSRYGAIAKVVEAIKLGAVDFVEEPIEAKKIQVLCDEILRRRALMSNDTVDELLHFAELALERDALTEVRVFLKMAMLRDENRAEPYYWLSELCEAQGDMREALYYYCRALDAGPTFQPARKALHCLKRLAAGTSASGSGNFGSVLAVHKTSQEPERLAKRHNYFRTVGSRHSRTGGALTFRPAL
jgi:FixJ family two-component response regulator